MPSTELDYAMQAVLDFAKDASCLAVPEVRIVFATPADQLKFKTHIVLLMDVANVASAPLTGYRLTISGVAVELSNKDRGPRIEAQRIIKAAEKACEQMNGRTIGIQHINALRDATHNLLALVRGI